MKSFNHVIASLEVDKKSNATIETKKKVFGMYEEFLKGETPSIENAEDFIRSKSSRSNNTLNAYKMGLRTFFNYNKIKIPEDSLKSIRKNSVREDKYVTPKQVDELYLVADNLRDKTIIRVLYHSGIRAKELVKLDIGNLDLDNQKINVRGVKLSHRVRVVRLILPELVIPTIRAYLKQRGIDYDNLSAEDKKQPLILSNKTKGRVTYDLIRNVFLKLRKSTGNPDLTGHWMRHGYVVWCKKQGIPPEITAKLIGDTVKTTVEIYSHYSEDDVDRVFSKIDGNLLEPDFKDKSPLDEIVELKEQNKGLLKRLDEMEKDFELIKRYWEEKAKS
jgi:integrase